MEKMSAKVLLLMVVLIPYLILVGYSIAVFPDLPDKLENGFPRVMIFLPAFIAGILPLTYTVMVFFFSHYLKKGHYLTVAASMDLGILGLVGAVYLIKSS